MVDLTLLRKRIFGYPARRLFVIVLFLFAFLPRLSAIGRYVTPDELIWVFRSIQFRQAILNGNWADTITTGHPGVMTTWLGASAISFQLMVVPASQSAYAWILKLAWFAPENSLAFKQLAVFLSAGRLVVAAVNSLGIVFVYLFSKDLFSMPVSVIGSLLLAVDPFVAGLSGLLHVDSLMTTFVTLSLLALARTWQFGEKGKHSGWYMTVSAIFAAFALLSKTPAVLLIPLSLFYILIAHLSCHQNKWVFQIRPYIKQTVNWIASYTITLFAALPALWVSPGQVVSFMSGEANKHLESALRPTFFVGDVAYEHGSLFYPVSLLFRLSPVVFIGIMLSVTLFVRWHAKLKNRKPKLLTISLLLSWILLFLIGITLAEKKFDRYAAAVIPAMIFIAAMYWGNLANKWRQLIWFVVITGQVVYLLLFLPYPLAAYNLLVGGSATAVKAMPLGWGEAISTGGQWLATLPDADTKTAVSPISPALAPFFPGETLLFDNETVWQADYLILTANTFQTESNTQIQAWLQDTTLLQTIRYGGLDQAWVFERSNPQQARLKLDSLQEERTFGNQLQLLAAGVDVSSAFLDVAAAWALVPGGENDHYLVNITLDDDQGNDWLTTVTPLLNETYFYPIHWQPGENPQIRYRWQLPTGIPPADYHLSLSLIEEASGAQLPILNENGRFIGTTLPIAQITIPKPDELIDPARLQLPITHDTIFLDSHLQLLGQEPLLETAVTGSAIPIDLYWYAKEKLSTDAAVQFNLGGYIWQTPLSRYATQRWRRGELIHEKYRMPIPPDIAPGHYELTIQIVAELEATVGVEPPLLLGVIQIDSLDRQFELPENIEIPLQYQFNNEIQLRGFDWQQTNLLPGDLLDVTLYWQVMQKPEQLYSVFFHVIGPNDETLVQADQWPGGLPSDLWVPGQVIEDAYSVELPLNAPEGEYTIAVGVYRPEDGLRLPIYDAAGNLLADDRILLPLK
jgi:4-amino-4-deoxy-L-arabinose transferase-like glycosyltransferase